MNTTNKNKGICNAKFDRNLDEANKNEQALYIYIYIYHIFGRIKE